MGQNAARTSVEWVRRVEPRRVSHVVFDFDGTLSWLRHGWPAIMQNLFRPHLPRGDDSPAAIEELLTREILSLNGKPTIFQMRRFAELVKQRGGVSPDPESLLAEYQRQLDEAIVERCGSIRSGACSRDDYLLYQAIPLLQHLIRRRLTPVILSSTVVHRVREEAELLGIAHFFGRHIYGGVGDPLKFSKRAVFERLLEEEAITGASMVSFGDGPVEIADTRHLGGVAIAVCSDEIINGSGTCHPQKRVQLIEAGADCVIPDFRDAIGIIDGLMGQG
jgi:phosphoglycolate phosphatase-like HAD superfamily hydrolase